MCSSDLGSVNRFSVKDNNTNHIITSYGNRYPVFAGQEITLQANPVGLKLFIGFFPQTINGHTLGSSDSSSNSLQLSSNYRVI